MLKTALRKVMWLTKGMLWVGRSTATVLGLAVMLALEHRGENIPSV
jgi:hypothetical protein